jgi:hypothetical protein
VNAQEALKLVVDRFPFLSKPVDRYVEEWARDSRLDEDPWPGLYNVWGDIVFPSLVEPLLSSTDEDESSLTALFDAIEKMAVGGDEYVKTFVGVGISESG